jgi:putative spermidine/putrescine transport system ATP-binding protein
VAVFNKGRIEQLAAPRELYLRPATPFVARFVGSSNVANAALAAKLGAPRRRSRCAPNITLQGESAPAPADHVCAPGAVLAVQFHGAASRWQIQLDAGEVWSALVPEDETRSLNGLNVGARVRLCWPPAAAVMLTEPGVSA